jgi:membrane-bound metal-dependent hydrolase YbcI (DUF457 family)
MDALTNTTVAVTLGMAGYKYWGRRGLVWVVLAANAPELERLVYLAGPAIWVKSAYGASHSLLMAPLLGLLLALIAVRRLRNARAAAAAVAAGLGSHLLLDMVSGAGLRIFWPFSSQFYGLRLLARYDLLTLAILLAALIGPRLLNLVNRDMGAPAYSPQTPARIGLMCILLLLAVRGAAKFSLEDRAQEETGSSFALDPSALSPLTWYVVSDAGPAYMVEEITPWSTGPTMRFRKPQSNRAFETAADTPLAQAFLQIAQFPHYTLERGEKGMLVRIRDLRFYAPAGQRKEFSVEIEVTPQLEVVGQRAQM